MNNDFSYEVETRFEFKDISEAYKMIPEIKGCLINNIIWESYTHSIELFKKDFLLRTSNIIFNNKKISYLGYKEPDFGKFFNIRKEIDEEITNITDKSSILDILKIGYISFDGISILELLKNAGHSHFMRFNGDNKSGYCKELDIAVKAMTCEQLDQTFILEIEKSVDSKEEISNAEKSLMEIIKKYDLFDRVIRDEPPTLLYKKILLTEEVR